MCYRNKLLFKITLALGFGIHFLGLTQSCQLLDTEAARATHYLVGEEPSLL